MKYKFGEASLTKLFTVESRLQIVMYSAINTGIMDFSVIEGHRNKKLQATYYTKGRSHVQWPDGKHNKMPSEAVDVVPYINGKESWNRLHCCVLAGVILACAAKLHVDIRWGGNWDMNGEPITDQDFQDLVHFELVR
jgi:peptidoglycan L-alanyl-D-glutamate endopeptidase CwlK